MKKLTAAVVFLGVVFSVTPTFAQIKSKNSKKLAETAKSIFYETHAYSIGNTNWISWDMDISSNSIAYEVLRLGSIGFERVSETPILNTQVVRGFLDKQGSFGDTYQIVAISPDGTRTPSGSITTELVDSLESVSGRSENALSAFTSPNSTIEKSLLVLPPELGSEWIKTAPPADLAAHRAVAIDPGVKIGIRKTGIYRVTRAELESAGFDVTSDRANWQLFYKGVEQGIIVEPSGSYIEFYARAIDTIESDIAVLYLVNRESPGKRMQNRVARPNIAPVVAQNYQQSYSMTRKVNYVYDILNGDLDNYWGDVFWNSGVNIPMTITGVDYSQAESSMNIGLHGFLSGNHAVTVALNGQTIGIVNGSGQFPFSGNFVFPTARLNEGANTLRLNTGASNDYVLFDKIKINYARKFQAEQNTVSFYTQSNKRAVIAGFSTANVRMFDVTNESEVMSVSNFAVTQNGSTFDVTLPAYRTRVYHTVENSSILTAFSVKPNAGSDLASTTNSAALVILSHPSLMAEAQNWATFRRNQGVTVKVVDIEDVYDEFNFGVSSSKSITDFLRYAKDNWQAAPQYVLLIGDASFDPRNYENLGYENMVPSKMVNTVYTETGSDDALVDFNNDGLAEMAIGRIVAKTPQIVADALVKTAAFETVALRNMNRGFIFAYDEPNGFDFGAMSNLLRNELPGSVPVTMVDRLTPGAQLTLVNDMNQGRYIANYAGHGTTANWYGSSFFGNQNLNPASSVPQLNNANNYSIFTMLTCLNGYFINPYAESLSERLSKHSNGGTAANWASTGKTTPDVQLVMAQRFFNRLSAGTIPRLGDLIKDSKAAVAGGTDVRLSWALFGDPMLQIR